MAPNGFGTFTFVGTSTESWHNAAEKAVAQKPPPGVHEPFGMRIVEAAVQVNHREPILWRIKLEGPYYERGK